MNKTLTFYDLATKLDEDNDNINEKASNPSL